MSLFKPVLPLLFVLVTLLVASASFAAPNECNLSLKPERAGACPVGAIGAATVNKNFTGASIDPHTDARVAIDAFGYCRYVGNGGEKSEFIPFGNEEEWRAYQTNHPKSVYLIQCTRGGALVMPPNFGKEGVTNQCVGLPSLQSIIVPYKPANAALDFTAPPVTYACKSNDGTEFGETAVAKLVSHDSGYGPGTDFGWDYSKILYAYNGICGPAQGVETATPPAKGLCSVGVASAIIGTGPFQWICSGGNGGGKNRTCSTGKPCEAIPDEVLTCRCEEGNCYRPVLHGDSCGHTWLDKSQICDNPEPAFKPLPATDYDSDFLTRK